MKKSIRIAVCGVVCALSLLLLFMGGAVSIFIYIMPMLTSFLMIMLRKTFSISDSLVTYIAASLLSVFLVGEKECMLSYVLFFGYYPIIYPSIQKIKSVILRTIVKLMIFNIMLTIIQLMLVYIFGIPFLSEGEGKIFIVLFAVMMNLILLIYDFTVKRIYILYTCRLEKKIKKYFKQSS